MLTSSMFAEETEGYPISENYHGRFKQRSHKYVL